MKKSGVLGIVSIMLMSLCACGSPNQIDDAKGETTTSDIVVSETESSQEAITELEVVSDDTTEVLTEVTSLSTDINDYINGDFFDVESYLRANDFNVDYRPAELPHGNSELVANCNKRIYHIFSGIGLDDKPKISNIYSMHDGVNTSRLYQCTTPSDLEHILNTPYEGFYMFSDQLYVLEYLVDNKDKFTEGSCPFAGSGIEHTVTENASPVEHND